MNAQVRTLTFALHCYESERLMACFKVRFVACPDGAIGEGRPIARFLDVRFAVDDAQLALGIVAKRVWMSLVIVLNVIN
jgi:hypothetical protein